MALRIMVYTGLLYQDLIKSKEVRDGDLLPPVFPLVLYNGLEEVDAMLAERVTQWTEQWKNEGKIEGQKEGQTALLERLLQKRFASAYDLKKQKLLQEASSEQFAIWAERVLDASSIDDVFRDE